MKFPQGVLVQDTLYVGGGFTNTLRTDSAIYSYQCSSNSWVSLPTPPSSPKCLTLVLFEKKLVIVGGRVLKPRLDGKSGNELVYTKEVAMWNIDKKRWEVTASMRVARALPVVISHGGYLLVGGGQNRYQYPIDHRTEILDPTKRKWMWGPDLPTLCNQKHSAVVGGKWYILDKETGYVFYTDLEPYIGQTVTKQRGSSSAAPKWQKILPPKSNYKHQKPFRLASLGSQLIAFVELHKRPVMFLLNKDNATWSMVFGQLLPLVTSSAMVLSNFPDLIVAGGEISTDGGLSTGFTDFIYKVSINHDDKQKEQSARKFLEAEVVKLV